MERHFEATPKCLEQEPGLWRTTVKLPKPRMPGAPNLVATRNAIMGCGGELTASGHPDYSLAPARGQGTKSWYNTYLYVPEERSHIENQYLERFVQSPDGSWIDVCKCRRMAKFTRELQEKAMAEEEVRGWSGVSDTAYTEPYSGEPLFAFKGELLLRGEMYARYGHHRSRKWQQVIEQMRPVDWDNLRFPPWPFGEPQGDTSKRIAPEVYEWYDRRNTFMPSDDHYEILNLANSYADAETYNMWRQSHSPEMLVPVASPPVKA
jgi:hypothetical protein